MQKSVRRCTFRERQFKREGRALGSNGQVLPGTESPTGHLPLPVASPSSKWVIKSSKSKQRQDVKYVNFCHLPGSKRHHCGNKSNIPSKPKWENVHCKVLLKHTKCNPVTNSNEIFCKLLRASALHHGSGCAGELWVRTEKSSDNLSKKVIRASKVKFFGV